MRPRAIVRLLGFLLLAGCDQLITVRTVDEVFSTGQADSVLLKASEVLVVRDAGNDIECPVRFLRSGSVSNHAGVSNTINTDSQMNRVMNLSGYAKVVHKINRCGGLSAMTIIGCARAAPTQSMVMEDLKDNDVVSTPASCVTCEGGLCYDICAALDPNPTIVGLVPLEGMLWAHEFGHTKGLNHRLGDARAVMNDVIATFSRNVIRSECDAFQLPAGRFVPPPPACVPVGCEGGVCTTSCGLPIASQRADIRDFVSRVYPDSVPYREAMQYGPADANVLSEMLADPRQRAKWPMAAMVLGVIGDDRAAGTLIDFVQRGRVGRMNGTEYRSIGSAMMALGYLGSRRGNAPALRFLMDASDPQYWKNQGRVRWTSRAALTPASRDQELSNFAMMGLGLSGRSEVWSHMQARWDALQLRRDRASDAEQQAMQEVVEQAMDDHRRVARSGLVSYYDRHTH